MTVHYTYPTAATPAFGTSAPGVNYLDMPEDSDGFIDKVVDAFGRGKSQSLAGVAIAEAIDNPNLDLNDALRVRAKLQRNEQLNPIESNWLSGIVYSSSRAAGQMFESVKKAGVGAAIGGAVGAGVGLLLPTVGEEVPLIGLGAKFGATVQAALFSFKSGRGEMYADMLDQGVGHDTAKLASGVASVPYALIEVTQLKALSPALKIGASQIAKASALRFVKQAAKTYGATLTQEVMEEIGQEGIQIVAEDVAKYLDGQGVPIDSKYFADRAARVWATAKEATKSFALLPVPGAAIEVGLQYHGALALQEIEQAEQKANQKQIIDPSDIESPIGKVQIAIDNSVNTWDAQERIRSKEKGIRIGEAKKYTGVELPTAIAGQARKPALTVTDINKAATGKSFSGTMFSGTGRGTVEEVYDEHFAREPIFGKAVYSAPKKAFATTFGPNVEKVQVNLKNPLVIKTDVELLALTKEAGLKSYIPIDSEEVAKLRQTIQDKGYDGVIIKVTGDEGTAKKILNAFEDDTIVDFSQPTPPSPAAKTGAVHPTAATTQVRQQSGDWKVRTKMALKKEYTKLGIQPLQELIPIENYMIMHQELGVTDKLGRFEALNLDDALEKLFKEGTIPRPFERKLFGKMWGPGIENSLDALTEVVEDKGPDIMDYFNLPRAASSALDLSRTGRQNVLMIGEPKLWFKALARDWHLLIRDDETARTLENDMQLRLAKAGDLLTKTGIRWNKYGEKAGYKTGTEKFASKLTGKIPGVARSERAYSVGGNLLRGEKILQVAEQREGFVTTDKQWKDIGHVVNLLTGEGDAKLFGKLAPVLNAIFFAPRLAEARVSSITEIFNPNLSWAARKILAWDVIKAIGINMSILGAMSLVPGVEVERDYRSTDFGKIKYGNTRIDFWGGYLPMARLVMRLYAGKVKTQSGRVIDVEATDTIVSFLQSKLGPVPAYLLDLARGETFYGDYVGITGQSMTQQFYQRFVPFVIQDIADAVHYQGWKTGVVGGAFAFHGVGVQTYPMSKGSEVLMRKNALAMEVLGRKWDETGPDVQAHLRKSFPQIEIMERQAVYDRSNFGFLEKITKEREATIERMTKKMSSDVREEFALLNLKVGGISRTMSTDWFLNENRAKDYEQQVTKAYQEILPKVVRLSHWNRVPPQTKVEILTEVMNEIKKGVRDQIIAKANISDFQQIKRGNE